MDRVKLEGLVLDASVGVYDFERESRQRVEIDVAVDLDLSDAGRSDRLEASLDYDRIAGFCLEVVSGRHHRLIESIAEGVASRTLETDPRIRRVEVRVAKPGAVPGARNVAVELVRRRE